MKLNQKENEEAMMQNHTTFVQTVDAVAEILEQISNEIADENTSPEEVIAGLQEVITSCNQLIKHLTDGDSSTGTQRSHQA
jgi:hypothetical protein